MNSRRPAQQRDRPHRETEISVNTDRVIFEHHRFIECLKYAGEVEFADRLKALDYRTRYCQDTYTMH